jgi:hypothetical protein
LFLSSETTSAIYILNLNRISAKRFNGSRSGSSWSRDKKQLIFVAKQNTIVIRDISRIRSHFMQTLSHFNR